MRRKNLNKILMVSLLSCLSIYGGFKAYNANASPNSQVNVTVPSDMSVVFNEDGTNTISNYNITNNSLVPITVDNINLSSKNGWSIVPSGSKILRDTKSLSLSLFDKWLNEGDNNMSVVISEGSNRNLSPLVERGAWTKEVKESAFDLNISYNIGKKDFTLSFNPNGGNGVESVVAKNGDSVTLPSATKQGYTFTGWLDSNGIIHNAGSSYTMPIGGDELVAQWKANEYTNVIDHWVSGMKNGEGTNDWNGNDAYFIGSGKFSFTTDSKFILDSSYAVAIPNGFKLRNTFGSSSIEGSWTRYPIGTLVHQKSYSMGFEYDYDPIEYNITYNLDGGINSPLNPNTYNVLYGVTLEPPIKEGYTFDGWYIGDEKVTGINEGCDAWFSSASDLYDKLSKRTTGDITLTAKWIPKKYKVNFDENYIENNLYDTFYDLGYWDFNSTIDSSNSSFSIKEDSSLDSGRYVEISLGTTLYGNHIGGYYYYGGDELEAGKTYTWSVNIKASRSGVLNQIGDEQNGLAYNVNVGTEWKTVRHTFTAQDTLHGSFTFYYPSTGSFQQGDKIYVSNLQLMEGSPSVLTEVKDYGSKLGVLPTVTREGYKFLGWYDKPNGGNKTSPNTIVSVDNYTYYARWSPNDNIKYRVNHYQMNLDGSTYSLVETENKTGISNKNLELSSLKKGYTGFTYDNGKVNNKVVSSASISPDGSTVVDLYYSRNKYKLDINGILDGVVHYSDNWGRFDVIINGTKVASSVKGYCNTSIYYGSTYEFKIVRTDAGRQFNGARLGSVVNPSDGNTYTGSDLNGTVTGKTIVFSDFTTINYSISYNLNGGTNPSNAITSYNINSGAITLPTPTRTGHTFEGWFDNSSFTGTAITSIPSGSTGNKTYYAKWAVNTYYLDVSGVLDGVSEYNTVGYGTFDVYIDGVLKAQGASDYYTRHPYGTSYEIKNIVPTIGHHYVGVHSGSLKGTIGAGHTTVRLSLNTNTYKVVYNSNVGSGTTSTSTHKYGEAKTLTPNGFSKTGYSFAGWATSASGSVAYSNGQSVTNLTATNNGTVNLYAKWTPNTNTKYVVNHYQMNLDGVNYTLKESESKTGTSDSSITVSNLKKTYTGFTYVNGKVGSSVVTTTTVAPDGSRVINLYYSRNKVVLDINAIVNGKVFGVGTPYMTYDLTVNGVKVQTQAGDGYDEVYYGSSYEVSNINAKPGYTYTGVKTGVIEGQGNGYALKGNVTDIKRHNVFLTFDINNYSITYNLNGGSISGQKTSYTIETATFSLPTPTRAGYLFTGWTGSNGSTPQTSVSIVKGSTGNKSYTANWTPKKLTTTFYRNLDSSDTTTAQQVFTYGLSQSFSAKGWSKTGYTQLGWADSRTATTQQYSTLSGVSDGWIESKYPSNNIYAIWRPNTYNIAYNANGGTGTTATSSHTYDSAKALTSNGFIRTGYTFAGWNTQANGSGTAYTNGQSVKNLTASNGATVTLYAQWKVNNYTLTFNPNGGSVSPTSKSVAYGSQYGTLPTPTRTGYTFTGWFAYSYGGTQYTESSIMGSSDLTIYACWTQKTTTLIDGPSFNSTLLSMLGNCTKISFTSTSIPSNKISTAKIVSNSNSTNKAYMYVDGSTLFISPDESGVSLIAPVDCTTMFLNAKTVTTLDLSNFNLTTSTAIMKRMFQGMSSLTSLDVSKFKTSNVTDMMQTFQDCRSLTSLDVSKFSTSKVTTMNYMFYGCSSLKTLTLTPGVRPTFVTTSVTDMSFMFAGCNSLPTVNLSSFNTSKVTNMSSMFNGCLSLTSLNLANFNTSNVTSMSGMFADCRSLASLNLSSFTDYNVTNFSYMFSECINLSNLNISNMGLHKATTVREMFYNCPKLSTTVTVRGNPSNYLYMFKYTATASGSMVSVNYTSSTSALVLSMIDTKSPNSNVTLGFTVYSLDSDSSNEESNESVDGVLKPSDTLPNEQPSEELDNVVSTPQVDSNGEDELVDEPSSNVESGTSSDVENEPSSDVDDVPSEDVEEIPPTDNAEEIPSSDTIKTPSDGVPIDTPNEDIPSGNDS